MNSSPVVSACLLPRVRIDFPVATDLLDFLLLVDFVDFVDFKDLEDLVDFVDLEDLVDLVDFVDFVDRADFADLADLADLEDLISEEVKSSWSLDWKELRFCVREAMGLLSFKSETPERRDEADFPDTTLEVSMFDFVDLNDLSVDFGVGVERVECKDFGDRSPQTSLLITFSEKLATESAMSESTAPI